MAPRVLTGLFGHETNTFSQLATGLSDFENYLLAYGDNIPEAVDGSVIEPAGVEQVAVEYGWELIRTVVAWATPSGRVARDAWDTCLGHIIATAEAAIKHAPLDGVLFSMHGAMATIDYNDAEGEFLERLGTIIGPNVPVAITLDLHANVTARMAKHADIICAYRTYPHIDQIGTVKRAAGILNRAMAGEVKPNSYIARRKLLSGLDSGRTTVSNPMTELLARAEKLERKNDGVLLISVQAGFCPADLEEAGPSVVVCGDGSDVRFQEIAEEFMDYAWESRHFDSNEYLSVDEAMAKLAGITNANGPVVIADASDNPGSGAYGDSTFLLNGMIRAGLDDAAFGSICDPTAAGHLIAAGEGKIVTIRLGGKIDPAYGAPIEVTGQVTTITDGSYLALGPRWGGTVQHLGPTAVLRIGGIDVIVASNRLQCTELETFTHVGIDPRTRRVIAVKSIHHFRAAYEPIASEILIIDSGALATKDLTVLPYKNLRRPIYPLDLD